MIDVAAAMSPRDAILSDLLTACGGDARDARDVRAVRAVCVDEPMAKHTSYGVGGRVLALAFPPDVDAAVAAVASLRASGTAYQVVGGGSNLLVADRGYGGVVLSLRRLRGVRLTQSAPVLLEVAAGEPAVALLKQAVRQGWGGLEFLAGLPGTVGGGIAMNAGAKGGDFAAVTRSVRIVDARGVRTLDASEVGFAYRHTALPADAAVLSCVLAPVPRAPADIERDARELSDFRKRTQPHGIRSAGSVFKNPPGGFAGKMIDELGMKGMRAGGAEISPVHANFIVTRPGATARDVLDLACRMRDRVRDAHGVTLEFEVRLVGDFDPLPEGVAPQPGWVPS